jgi:pilus assembly protein Flp/PilA
MKTTPDLIGGFVLEEDGVTSIEYGLLAGLLAISIITGATALGGQLGLFFTGIGNWFSGVVVP